MAFIKFKLLFVFILMILSESVMAAGILDQIGWRDPSRNDPTLILAVGIIIAAFAILIYRVWLDSMEKIEERKKRHAEEEFSRKEFSKRRRQAGLNESEADLLLFLLKNKRVSKPHTVFESVTLFESCVDLEIRNLLLKKTAPTDRMERGREIMKLRERLGFNRLSVEVSLASTRNMISGQAGAVYGRSSKSPDRLVLLINRAEIMETGPFTFKLKYDAQKEESCYFLPGERISFSFSRDGDARYRVALTVAGAGTPGIVELYHSSNLKRSQSRREFRLDMEKAVVVKVLKKSIMSNNSEIKKGENITAKMCTISGGGLSFIHEGHLGVGDMLEVDFDIMDSLFTGIPSKILSVLSLDDELKRYKYLIQFVDIENTVREQIVKQVFEMARRKGLGEESVEEAEDEELDDGIYIVN